MSALDDELRTEAARLSAESYAGRDDEKDILPRANTILKSFHARHVQALVRRLDGRIAATPRDDVATLNALQAEKIALRRTHATPPALTA